MYTWRLDFRSHLKKAAEALLSQVRGWVSSWLTAMSPDVSR